MVTVAPLVLATDNIKQNAQVQCMNATSAFNLCLLHCDRPSNEYGYTLRRMFFYAHTYTYFSKLHIIELTEK